MNLCGSAKNYICDTMVELFVLLLVIVICRIVAYVRHEDFWIKD